MNRRSTPWLLCAAVLLVPAAAARAQSLPAGWAWRAQPGPAAGGDPSWSFEQMPPGWHVTTGPAGLLYLPAERAAGRFTLAADFVVFPATTDSGYGLFVGGSGLEGASPSYLATLLRRDGSVSVVRRAGAEETVVLPWTARPAILAHAGSGTVTNRLRLQAAADSLRVFVNDSAVVSLAVPGEWTEGAFGFSAGAGVNLHITILDHTRHLAPARAATRSP